MNRLVRFYGKILVGGGEEVEDVGDEVALVISEGVLVADVLRERSTSLAEHLHRCEILVPWCTST